MTICQFFQAGHCRYGNRCRFEHARMSSPDSSSYYSYSDSDFDSNDEYYSPMSSPSSARRTVIVNREDPSFRVVRQQQQEQRQLPQYNFSSPLNAQRTVVVARQPNSVNFKFQQTPTSSSSPRQQERFPSLPAFNFSSPGSRTTVARQPADDHVRQIPVFRSPVKPVREISMDGSHMEIFVQNQPHASSNVANAYRKSENFKSPMTTSPGGHNVIMTSTPLVAEWPDVQKSSLPSFSFKSTPQQQHMSQVVTMETDVGKKLPTSGAPNFRFQLPERKIEITDKHPTSSHTLAKESSCKETFGIFALKDATYSKIEELDPTEMAMYKSKENFKFGKVPLSPPPIEFCH